MAADRRCVMPTEPTLQAFSASWWSMRRPARRDGSLALEAGASKLSGGSAPWWRDFGDMVREAMERK